MTGLVYCFPRRQQHQSRLSQTFASVHHPKGLQILIVVRILFPFLIRHVLGPRTKSKVQPPPTFSRPRASSDLLTIYTPAMSRLFRRALSTTTPAAYGPGPSRARTLPMAVRERQAEFPFAQRKSPLTQPELFESGGETWPAVLEEQFQKVRKAGQYKGDETSARKAFLKVNQQWRQRVRGGHTRVLIDDKGGSGGVPPHSKAAFLERQGESLADKELSDKYRDAIMGQKIFLPNIQIKLVRNNTKPGEAYDPWVATFRIPPSMTKNDLRSYLLAVYGLEVTFIRTELRVGKVTRDKRGRQVREGGADANFKRAVVGLTEPFHYPDDVEEMRAGTFGGAEAGELQAQDRERMLDGEFLISGSKEYQKQMMMKILKGARWRGKTANAVSVTWAEGPGGGRRQSPTTHGADSRETSSARSPAAARSARTPSPEGPPSSPLRTACDWLPRARHRRHPRPPRPRRTAQRPPPLRYPSHLYLHGSRFSREGPVVMGSAGSCLAALSVGVREERTEAWDLATQLGQSR